MNKIVVGLIIGGILGIFDGATAWFTPAVRAQMVGIIIGSTLKGMIAGAAAGWFARRVRSVPLGIAFGFAIGLLLAYLVAAMPDPSGKHYWLEIMLPGSIVGAIVGWATQRYGRPAAASSSARAAVVMLALMIGATAFAAEPVRGISATEAFDRLKSLSGEWNGNIMTADGPVATISYAVTAGGNTVMEKLFAGTPHEMITMYAVDGKELVGTHYCAAGNQPRLMLNRAASSNDLLVFDFAGVTGADAGEEYINSARIEFLSDGRVESVWGSSLNDKPAQPKKFFLKRK